MPATRLRRRPGHVARVSWWCRVGRAVDHVKANIPSASAFVLVDDNYGAVGTSRRQADHSVSRARWTISAPIERSRGDRVFRTAARQRHPLHRVRVVRLLVARDVFRVHCIPGQDLSPRREHRRCRDLRRARIGELPHRDAERRSRLRPRGAGRARHPPSGRAARHRPGGGAASRLSSVFASASAPALLLYLISPPTRTSSSTRSRIRSCDR